VTINQRPATEHTNTEKRGRSWDTSRDPLVVTGLAYIGYNVVASIVGLIAKLPDVTSTHQKTTTITVGQFLSDGTIVSPPLFLMVAAALLLWGATNRRAFIARTCTLALAVGVALTVIAEVTGLSPRPSLFTEAKWNLAIAVGIIFAAFGAAVIVVALRRLYLSFRITR
jgi:hypothetical protein